MGRGFFRFPGNYEGLQGILIVHFLFTCQKKKKALIPQSLAYQGFPWNGTPKKISLRWLGSMSILSKN